jgi:3-carboxy-cis,cis-muconate cycloisomerase
VSRICRKPGDGGSYLADNAVFGALFGNPDVDREVGGHAWLQALLDAERSLAVAQARAGLIPESSAAAIAACCDAGRFDAAAIGRRALAAGNPVVPLVSDLRAMVSGAAASHVHQGATSQDIVDTATMLVSHRALGPILADLGAAAGRCAELAEQEAGTVMAGRTLLQQALPIVFGLKCAGWLTALDEAAGNLGFVRSSRLAIQFGGAAGTLASLGAAASTVPALLASELRLAEPVLPWHTDRTRVAELGCALGVASGALAKIALDVLLLAQTEIAEVSEAGGPGRGGSSTLPHKRNPVGAILVNACTRRLPGLVATLLASMAQEHERAAGGWHAEWETLSEALRLTGAAARHSRQMLAGLRVDADRMRGNLALTKGLIMAESVTARLSPALGRSAAQELVTRVCAQAAERGEQLRDALLAEPAVTGHLDASEVDAALDPAAYLGCAGQFIARALARHAALAGSAQAAQRQEGRRQ